MLGWESGKKEMDRETGEGERDRETDRAWKEGRGMGGGREVEETGRGGE